MDILKRKNAVGNAGFQVGRSGHCGTSLKSEGLDGVGSARPTQARQLVKMEYRRFLREIIEMPCQILRTGRRLVYRQLDVNGWSRLLLEGSAWLKQQPVTLREIRRMPLKMRRTLTILLALVIGLSAGFDTALSQDLKLENDFLVVKVDEATGSFAVTERITGQVWEEDPWEEAAALLTVSTGAGQKKAVNLSKSRSIRVGRDGNAVTIMFTEPVLASGEVLSDASVEVRLRLHPAAAVLDAEVLDVREPRGTTFESLTFPARHFSLRTDEDRGAAVIPYWQGRIAPSYIFPMTGGRFCMWDDIHHGGAAIGRVSVYGYRGLSMPWWGTYSERSAVLGILGSDLGADMEYVINSNGQENFFSPKGEWSPYPRILALSPVWDLREDQGERRITYHFIPGGDHVQMARRYREIAQKRGHLVTLKEKARRNPEVEKLAGALYLGVYGGYPHYVGMPGMAFTFDDLKSMIRTVHDSLGVQRAIIHAWGTFSNHPPQNWPISEALGGAEKLREAVDLAKEHGYLYSSYHAYIPALAHDPEFTTKYLPENERGEKIIRGRWGRNDPRYFKEMTQKTLPKELEAIGQNADVTDISFIQTSQIEERIAHAKYIRSHNLVMGTERGQEVYIPYFDFFEGLANASHPRGGDPFLYVTHAAPLFNLVYHDAIATYGKIQDPDNDVTFEGDFRIKSLRNLLDGSGPLIFFAPYEFEGMKPMIRMASELVAPVHRETFFSALTDHAYLSPDFKVQRSGFSNGTEVTVNLGPVAQETAEGIRIAAYGFRIQHADGELSEGSFELNLSSASGK